jgi:arabinogalactan endo-1,4-beta-galactosidase
MRTEEAKAEKEKDKDKDPGEIRRALDEVKRLRDEVRVRIHLAEMDARDAWHKLEPRIDKLDRQFDKAGTRVSIELKAALEQARTSLKALRDRL